jgi:hypothetical protein
MRTLPKEPWRGGQVCGYQTNVGGWSEGQPEYCGEFKKPGSPLCDEHDAELREEYDGVLPTFAPGNAPGLAVYRRTLMPYMFQLAWETEDPDKPKPATPEEIAAWEASGS